MNRTGIILAAVGLLAACGEAQKPYQPPLPHSGEKAAVPQLFPSQREALDTAKGLGQSVEQSAKVREEAAEKAVR